MRRTHSIGAITWLVEPGKAMFTPRFIGTVTALAAAAALVANRAGRPAVCTSSTL